MCFLMQCYPDLSKGNSSWPRQTHGLQDLPQNLYNVLMQIHPKYLLFRWELQCWRLKPHPPVPRDALSPRQGQVNCFRTVNSQQFSSFILSILLTSILSLSRGFLWFGREKRTATAVSPLPKGQMHLTLYPCSFLPSPPSWAQLWLPHILDRGHFPEKHDGIFKTTSHAERQPNVASFPTAFTVWVQHPAGGCPSHPRLWGPQLFSTPVTMIPFLHVTPSSHQKPGQHDPKWSFFQSSSNPKATQVPVSHDAILEGVNWELPP